MTANLFTAAKERATLEAAMAKYMAGGGKVTRLEAVYQRDKEPDLSPEVIEKPTPARHFGGKRPHFQAW
ncbi:MAG TPA: hypothetical protein HPQ04_04530 [Rhodospirillaceae bacterium]|nr:hypothetical protein [Rhodospirillaceae bacterium]